MIEAATDLERRTMQLYCRFESLFSTPKEVCEFWFDMAQHESRHVGALALVVGLLDSASERALPAPRALTRDRIQHLDKVLSGLEKEARRGITLTRAFEVALEIESSEIEDLVLDLLTALKGQSERERAMQLLIHDLGDLSYMIERYSTDQDLLARADALIETQLGRLRETEKKPRQGRGQRAAR